MTGRRTVALAVLTMLSFGLAACGQMGPLTLPDDSVDDQQEDGEEQNER